MPAPKGNSNAKNFPRTAEYRDKMSAALKGKTMSNEHKNKISLSRKGQKPSQETREKMSKNNKGWASMRNGRSKWYEVQMPDGSISKVQGTYELRYAQHLLSQGIDFVCQPKPGLPYVDQFGGTHTYYPDFWVHSLNSYVEIKSTYTLSLRGARKKLEMVQKANHPLIILTEVELSEMGIDMKSRVA